MIVYIVGGTGKSVGQAGEQRVGWRKSDAVTFFQVKHKGE